MGEPGVPGVPLPLVGPRYRLLHGRQLHDLHPRLRRLALVHHARHHAGGIQMSSLYYLFFPHLFLTSYFEPTKINYGPLLNVHYLRGNWFL
jgi:hypothetical protein